MGGLEVFTIGGGEYIVNVFNAVAAWTGGGGYRSMLQVVMVMGFIYSLFVVAFSLDWRAWFVLDLRLTGRNLYRALHAVVGGWIFAAYLLSGMTGLWWSYDWYRQGVRYVLTGKAGEMRREGRDGPPKGDAVPLAPAWAGFVGQVGADGYARVAITPSRGGKPVEMRVLPPDARFDRQTDTLRFDARDGRLVKADRYAARPWGETIVGNVLPLHTGAFFGLPGRIVMLLTSATMPLFTVTGLLLYLARRRRKRALAAVPDVAAAEASGETLVLYASQTGGAERLARLTAGALGATLRPLGGASAEEWRAAQRILFVAATYGEGEPPDAARGFAARAMAGPGDLAGKDYAVLALGDREYAGFCAFGHRVDAWAHDSGARRLFDMIEIDGADVDAEHRWQQQVFALAGGAGPAQSDWQRAPFAPWRLAARAHVNPGSPGAPMHRIVLEPVAQDAAWQPGAIAEVMPRHDPARSSPRARARTCAPMDPPRRPSRPKGAKTMSRPQATRREASYRGPRRRSPSRRGLPLAPRQPTSVNDCYSCVQNVCVDEFDPVKNWDSV